MDVSLGSSHTRTTSASPGSAVRLAGFAGRVVDVVSSDGSPAPAGLAARSWNLYVTPFTRSVTVWDVAVAAVLTVSQAFRFVVVGAVPADTVAFT